MYGIPNMKLDKRIVKRRTDFTAAEGVIFKTGVAVGEQVQLLTLKPRTTPSLLPLVPLSPAT